MLARIEVAVQPAFQDPAVQGVLRRLALAHPQIAKKVRWARLLDVYWIDAPVGREEFIPMISEVFWDRVLQWMFTGNLIPSAAGKWGGIQDLTTTATFRPGKFYALERRFRAGVTDNLARTAVEAMEIVLGRKLPEARVASGSMLLLEGAELNEDLLGMIARDVFCNELIETWTILDENELNKSDRFHQERVKRDIPKMLMGAASGEMRTYPQVISDVAGEDLAEMSKRNLWALSQVEMEAVRAHFKNPTIQTARAAKGLPAEPTDVEMECIAQTWSEHCKHKIFGAQIQYSEFEGTRLTKSMEIDSLFKTTIAGTTAKVHKPWLLSVFDDNAGIVAFDEEDAFCIKVETHNSPSALDPYGGALTGIVGVNRDILGCGYGAKPIFNTDVFCVAPLDYDQPLPDRLMHPRRILDGVRRGVESGGNKSGIPTVNGALVFDERYLGKPLVYCGTGGFMPRAIGSRKCEVKEILPGDAIYMVGGRIGKDGIHGATFSSLALDESSPSSAVQLGDPITQKRAADFLLEARDIGLYRAITDNGAGGLSSSVGEMARLSGGARLDVGKAKVKYPGLKPYELFVSESQERMTVAVQVENCQAFEEMALRRGVEVSRLGEFTDSGTLEVQYQGKTVAALGLEFLHKGNPKLKLEGEWRGRPALPDSMRRKRQPVGNLPTQLWEGHWLSESQFDSHGPDVLKLLLSRPNIASKEWMIRQYDHEVQGTSVIKPLHHFTAGNGDVNAGPNDASVIKPKATSDLGLAIGCGINPKLSDIDPYLMAQSAVDEALRNVLCVGAEFGRPESVVSLCDNFCWPDPVGNKEKTGWLVRTCLGLQDAALAMGVPLVSGKDSMKNDFRGKRAGQPVTISVPPTLLMTAVARVADVKSARSSEFKSVGDRIYVLGSAQLGLQGSEFGEIFPVDGARVAEPNWNEAKRTYSWLGGSIGREQSRLKSVHDVSEGGIFVSAAESALVRGYGVQILADSLKRFSSQSWEAAFGEGFHAFVISVAESDATALETEWASLDIPFMRIGQITPSGKFEVLRNDQILWSVSVSELRTSWQKGGYWE